MRVVQYLCQDKGVKCIPGKKPNLRDSGEMGWVLHVHINLGTRETIVLSEMLNCMGNYAVPMNSKSGKEKFLGCLCGEDADGGDLDEGLAWRELSGTGREDVTEWSNEASDLRE
jgi:hypothetical protein